MPDTPADHAVTISTTLSISSISQMSQPSAAIWLRIVEDQLDARKVDLPAIVLRALQQKAAKPKRKPRKDKP